MSRTHFSGPLYVADVEIVDADGNVTAPIEMGTLEEVVDANGNELLEFTTTASAVNHINIANTATGTSPVIMAAGEANTGVTFVNSEAEEILILSSQPTSVNELTIASNATGLSPIIAASGDDANVGIQINPKGVSVLEVLSEEGTAVGAHVRLQQDSASPAISDVVGRVDFSGLDDGAATQDYARIDGEILTATAGTESGLMRVYAADGSGSLAQAAVFAHNGSGGLVSAGDGAAAGTFQSAGAQTLILATGDASAQVNLATSGVFTLPSGMLSLTTNSKTPNNDDGGGSQINPGERQVEVGAVTNNADDWIILPSLSSVDNGHEITILCNAGGGFEMRTPTTSNELINGVDSDGSNEYLCTDTEVIKAVKMSNAAGWMVHAYSAAGAVVTAVVPDNV